MHESSSNFVVVCNIDGCKNSYASVRSLTAHVKKKHSINDETVSSIANTFDTATNLFLTASVMICKPATLSEI